MQLSVWGAKGKPCWEIAPKRKGLAGHVTGDVLRRKSVGGIGRKRVTRIGNFEPDFAGDMRGEQLLKYFPAGSICV